MTKWAEPLGLLFGRTDDYVQVNAVCGVGTDWRVLILQLIGMCCGDLYRDFCRLVGRSEFMSTHSRMTMLAFGLALAMLAVATLIAALYLSARELEAARQQARAWETYALSLHRRDLFETRNSVVEEVGPPYGLVARRLEIVDVHPRRPGVRF